MNLIKKNNFHAMYMAAFLTIVILTFIDQITKYLAVAHLKGSSSFVLIPEVLELRYLENKGMAFGMFSGKIPLFVIACILFLIFAVYFFVKVPKNSFYYPAIVTVMILTAGAVGNFIDRIWHGYVIDFIYFKLINFPIFNLADMYVVAGCIILLLLIIFKYEDADFKFLSWKRKER